MRSARNVPVVVLLAAALSACAGTSGELEDAALHDAGTASDGALEAPDGSTADAGPDTGGRDAEGFDAEPADAEVDAGSQDAALADTGATDAGAIDGGATDAGLPDSGWGGCSVDGVAGTCMDVSLCTGDRMATPGHCPGPAEIQCCTPRGAAFACDPAVHQHPNAGLTEEPGLGGCPPGMVLIPASPPFCVDRFEAALLEVHGDGTITSWSPYHHPGNRRVRAVSLRGAVPQGYIDQVRAAAACTDAGKRLCTNAEWLRACRGPDGLTFPYGATRQPGVCNDARARHPAIELFPNDPMPFARIQDACLNQLPNGLGPTAARAGCVTAEGAFDMMGNLHEWTSDPAGTFRGGFYVDTMINGAGCLYLTTAHNVHHWDYSTGFRCCADGP